jgi:hypothetical protein
MAQFCKVETDKTKPRVCRHNYPHSLIILLFYYIQQIDSMYLYILEHVIIYRMVWKVSNQKRYITLKQSIQKKEEYQIYNAS